MPLKTVAEFLPKPKQVEEPEVEIAVKPFPNTTNQSGMLQVRVGDNEPVTPIQFELQKNYEGGKDKFVLRFWISNGREAGASSRKWYSIVTYPISEIPDGLGPPKRL